MEYFKLLKVDVENKFKFKVDFLLQTLTGWARIRRSDSNNLIKFYEKASLMMRCQWPVSTTV